MKDYAVVDSKTPIHFLIGLVAGMSGLDPAWAAVAVIGFESSLIAMEGGLSAPFEKRFSQSAGNQAVDMLVGILGVSIGESIRSKKLAQTTPVLSGWQQNMKAPYVHANRW